AMCAAKKLLTECHAQELLHKIREVLRALSRAVPQPPKSRQRARMAQRGKEYLTSFDLSVGFPTTVEIDRQIFAHLVCHAASDQEGDLALGADLTDGERLRIHTTDFLVF